MLVMWFVSVVFKFCGREYEPGKRWLPEPKTVPTKQTKEPPDKHTEYKSNTLFRLGIISALNVVAKTPKFITQKDKKICQHIKQYKSNEGLTQTNEISKEYIPRIREIMHLTSCDTLLGPTEMYDVIIDTGCSNSASAYMEDFVKGSVKPLAKPITIEGIGGDIQVKEYGLLNWECIDNQGNTTKLQHYGHYAPALKNIRLLSPQRYLEQSEGKTKFVVTKERCYFEVDEGQELEAMIHTETGLPTITAFANVQQTSKKIAALYNIITPENKNLTTLQKEMLKWHYRIGHVGFQSLQWIGRQGILGKLGEKWGASTCTPPKCEVCQVGKQHRKPTQGSTTKRTNEGILYTDKLNPGDLVFSDQFESSMKGRYYNSQGKMNTHYSYRGGTIFYDAASKYIQVTNQVGFTAYETIEAKLKFEREAMGDGVVIKKYCTDNGVYTAREFQQSLSVNNQTIQHSGVGGHHHNAPAENAIKIIVHKARTMMFQSAICWPEHTELSLWPMAIQYAVHLYNHTPNPATSQAPIEIWTKSKSSYSTLRQAQTWGCPAYVLEPRLQDGKKIPKWEPRSRRGQFLGYSPLHASTVGMIRNLRTNNISPQFHVVYDTHFETVHSDHKEEPKVWEELLFNNRHIANFDDKQYLPELADEWLSPEDIQKKRMQENPKMERKTHIESSGFKELDPPNEADSVDITPRGNTDDMENTKTPYPVSEGVMDESKSQEDKEVSVAKMPVTEKPNDEDSTNVRRSSRRRSPPTRFTFDKQHGYLAIKSYLSRIYRSLNYHKGYSYNTQYMLALIIDPQYGVFDSLPMNAVTNSPQIFKAGNKKNLTHLTSEKH